MAQSLVNDAEQSGSFPRWALANTATAEMTGDSVVPLIANFYAFGAKDFDVDRALHFMLDAATGRRVGRRGYVERPAVGTYLQRGYLPLPSSSCHGSFPAASISLEWSVDDFAISQFARRWAILPLLPNSRTGRTCITTRAPMPDSKHRGAKPGKRSARAVRFRPSSVRMETKSHLGKLRTLIGARIILSTSMQHGEWGMHVSWGTDRGFPGDFRCRAVT